MTDLETIDKFLAKSVIGCFDQSSLQNGKVKVGATSGEDTKVIFAKCSAQNQSNLFLAMLVIKQQEKYNTKLETKTIQCAGRLRVDLAVFKSAATVN